ncbi:hypothetical protein DFH09DRAFT_1105064 [Mycena vulgaris]|nr:hypothetical protein DFH09DRAFT_1105064 [Mycena vulgaris]
MCCVVDDSAMESCVMTYERGRQEKQRATHQDQLSTQDRRPVGPLSASEDETAKAYLWRRPAEVSCGTGWRVGGDAPGSRRDDVDFVPHRLSQYTKYYTAHSTDSDTTHVADSDPEREARRRQSAPLSSISNTTHTRRARSRDEHIRSKDKHISKLEECVQRVESELGRVKALLGHGMRWRSSHGASCMGQTRCCTGANVQALVVQTEDDLGELLICEDGKTIFVLPRYLVRGAHFLNAFGAPVSKVEATFYLNDVGLEFLRIISVQLIKNSVMKFGATSSVACAVQSQTYFLEPAELFINERRGLRKGGKMKNSSENPLVPCKRARRSQIEGAALSTSRYWYLALAPVRRLYQTSNRDLFRNVESCEIKVLRILHQGGIRDVQKHGEKWTGKQLARGQEASEATGPNVAVFHASFLLSAHVQLLGLRPVMLKVPPPLIFVHQVVSGIYLPQSAASPSFHLPLLAISLRTAVVDLPTHPLTSFTCRVIMRRERSSVHTKEFLSCARKSPTSDQECRGYSTIFMQKDYIIKHV